MVTVPAGHTLHAVALIPEHQRKAGLLGGLAALRSGQIQELGRTQGRRNAESGVLARARTPEHQRKGGRLGGGARMLALTPEQRIEIATKASHSIPVEQRALNSGKSWIGMTPEQRSARSRKGSLAALTASTPGQRSRNGRTGSCSHWNIRRGKPCTCGQHEFTDSFSKRELPKQEAFA